MKKNLLLLAFAFSFGMVAVQAQTDMTSSITNPSFEDNVNDMATGWTYEGGADTLIWHIINTDGDATKDGDNICGLWHGIFYDPAITQTITGLDNGTYKVTAGFTIGVTGATPGQRLTTQRIFANDNSVLYGAETAYTEATITILTETLGETISYAGYEVSSAENGPFQTCEVTTEVTDGTLILGVKTNGTGSEYGFVFPDADESGWGWFKVDNFTLTYMDGEPTAIQDKEANPLKAYASEGFILVEGASEYKIYNLNGVEMNIDQQLRSGLYLVVAGDQVKKVMVY